MGEGKGPASLLSFLKKRTKKLLCCCKDNHIVLYMLLLLPAVGIICVFLPPSEKNEFCEVCKLFCIFYTCTSAICSGPLTGCGKNSKLCGNLRTYDMEESVNYAERNCKLLENLINY